VQYTKERRQFGKAIAEFQLVQGQLARMATEVEAARLLVYNAARLRDAASRSSRGGDGQALLVGGGRTRHIARHQPLRRLRLREDYPVEKLWRDAKIGQIYEGTSNMQLVTIAKQLLG